MDNLKFASENDALQCLANITGKRIIIAAPLDRELSSEDVYDILKSDSGSVAWLWDKRITQDFVEGGKHHFALAEKIVKKHKLAKNYEEQEEKAEEIVDNAIRGYFFPKTNQIAIYPIKSGSRYIEPKGDTLSFVIQKLGGKVNSKTKGISILDEYYANEFQF
jgi:hypothetical protein